MIFDLHNDFPSIVPSEKLSEYADDFGGDTTVTAAVFTSEIATTEAHRRIAVVRRVLSCGTVAPIAVEDLGFLTECDIDTFDFCGLFYCSLTWNYDNAYAGGALGSGRLTNSGRKLIDAMNGKCAVDLAHLNKSSFFDVLDCAQNPICSHTGFMDHPRCLDRAQIQALVRRNVPIGLSAVTKFSGANSAREFAAVIDGYVQHYGCDNLCIGTDFNGSTDLPNDLCDYSMFDAVVAELKDRGYSECDTDKILYYNAKRFYKEIVSERYL